MPSFTEAEMIKKARDGDTDAFRWLVEKHQAFAFALSLRFVGVKDEAEDIVQEAFVRLWRNLERYREGIKVKTWLYTIVTNLCLDFLKSRRGREIHRRVSLENQFLLTDHVDPESLAMGQEFKEAVGVLLHKLTSKQRAVFVLRDLEELGMNEISRILAMSPGSVKSNLYYARLNVTKLIKMYYRERAQK
jgi:RNA polymerase sigma-70 factor, ECF subfamily